MPAYRTWEISTLIEAVKSSECVSDVVRKLGLKAAGGSHKHIRNQILRYGIDTSHFNPGKAKGRRFVPKISNDLIFCKNSTVSRNCLKNRLKSENRISYTCAICGNNGTHLGAALVLQIDHINGVNNDNRLDNLRWLCPNCHSQTPTWSGKNSR